MVFALIHPKSGGHGAAVNPSYGWGLAAVRHEPALKQQTWDGYSEIRCWIRG
jgi:hypothetical protein